MQPSERVRLAREKFVATPDDWNRNIADLMVIYGVGRNKITGFRRLVGVKTQFEIKRERDKLIIAHPGFGESGQAATVSSRTVANDFDVELSVVCKLRREQGVEPYLRPYADEEADYTRRLSSEEKRSYALCALTRTWGRAV